ncbi:nitrous oxide reductase accessory protein NosL [Diaphorobacter nitroreducens]|uniref:nitrous oxide reductase accessory protein NosL n=1 Tax=Diaphorobacter nitroreducens TaxID=164759 RepID=UPI0028B003A7|nr:nitrous oxide reductase accessory protein NosL [Diaphorobacter nitroreducens]
MLVAGTLAFAAAAGGLWGVPGLRSALRPEPAPALEPDVCIVAPPTPYDPASGLPPTAARPIPVDARCPVCGMFPARSPDWAAQVIFRNGDAQFFDSPLSLFMYLQDVARYSPGRSARDIMAHYVTDTTRPAAAGGARWTDALSAYYVHGSSARGPMRAGNLPAFSTREAAQAFAAQRGGTVLAFGAVDAPLIAQLAGPGGHNHP